ncbi:MAG TPA: hypothetical protein V6D22_03215 [Candidatus Obscuribacterales bacterium]
MHSFEQSRPTNTAKESAAAAQSAQTVHVIPPGAPKSAALPAGLPGGGADRGQAAPNFERTQTQLRIERFFELINDSHKSPERRALNERMLDQLLCAIDRDTDAALLRRETLLKATGANEALIEYRIAKANYEACLAETDDMEMRQVGNLYLNGFGKLNPEVTQKMRDFPGLMTAADRLAAAQRNPLYFKGQNIILETRQAVLPSINLRAVYAQMLSETGRSGKAVSLIVQAKELRSGQRC